MTGSIKVLLPHFPSLVSSLEPDSRFDALERVFCHGKPLQVDCELFDELRWLLSGLEPVETLPIAALTRLSDGEISKAEAGYVVRVDPVTLITDMSRVVMTRQGFGDLNQVEQKNITSVVESVLVDEGLNLSVDHPERWTIQLDQPLPFDFTHIENALGLDISEVLPDHPEALHWRKIFNEIQMALHASDVNKLRRQNGQMEINSVWFWGGGTLPPTVHPSSPQQVFSNHPVSAGLARLQSSQLYEQEALLGKSLLLSDKDILVDWTPGRGGVEVELGKLNTLIELLTGNAKKSKKSIELYDRSNHGWIYRPSSIFHRFSRTKPLSVCMNTPGIS